LSHFFVPFQVPEGAAEEEAANAVEETEDEVAEAASKSVHGVPLR
jgi:hypothetical protein